MKVDCLFHNGTMKAINLTTLSIENKFPFYHLIMRLILSLFFGNSDMYEPLQINPNGSMFEI
ncbi:MAG: hypothetical protein CM15mP106_7550 [Candidatus Neomarinimicrobiota bacterium]|nr:MAG: hypothetical protein CM15mP106_7550 [Candidatus Neomarinimicrobiota bacterium]